MITSSIMRPKVSSAWRLLLWFGILSLALLSAAEQKFWDKQDPTTWTPDQVTQFTTSSPWAKKVTAELLSNASNMAANTPRTGSTGRGRSSRGTADTSTVEMPKLQGVVQWVSAKPMQQVLKLHLPASFQGRYVVGVSGLPVSNKTKDAIDDTTLQSKHGDAVHPEDAYQDPADTSAIYFAFLPSTIDLDGAKTAVFTMVVSPYSVKAKFNISEMKYRGEPAL